MLFCFGTRPIQAAKCRAEAKFDTSPTVATIADAVIGPMPGIAARRRLATLPLVLVVRSDLGARDLAKRLARYGSVGVGARTHQAMTALMRRAGIVTEHIPYRGGADQIQGLLRGDVPMGFASVALAAPMLGEGRLRALARSSAARSPALPDLCRASPSRGWSRQRMGRRRSPPSLRPSGARWPP
jgi:tripartite-type tricarboxylate transporter receptor subunit TctC